MSEQVTVKEYAAIFRLHVQTVYRAIRAGRIQHPVIRIGSTIRISVPTECLEERKSA